jgi:hypothetical protein
MNRWKVLPHRLNDGRCRDCGRHVAATAPDTCCRCAIERYKDLGHPTIANPVNAFELHGREMWRLPAIALRSGEMRSGMFYPWIGHADGGTLERPLDELLDNGREVAHAGAGSDPALFAGLGAHHGGRLGHATPPINERKRSCMVRYPPWPKRSVTWTGRPWPAPTSI